MRCTLILPVLLMAACAAPLDQDEALTVLPYEIRPGGKIGVDVRVNMKGPFRFVVDTAASGSFITPQLADELSLERVPGLEALVFGAVASGRFPIVDVARLEIGAVVLTDTRLTVLPEAATAAATIDGILGADFLRHYAIGFDVRERSLRLYSPDIIGARTYRGWEPLPMTGMVFGNSLEPLHFVEITIGDRKVPALFDLGAGISILNSPAARHLQLTTISGEERGEFSGAIGSETITARLSSQALNTGPVRWRHETFLISDPAIFTTLGYADDPLAIIGSGLFLQRDFIIDFTRERLLVRTAMSEIE